MLGYLVHRILIMIPTLIAISIVIFMIIHLPPGDYFTTYIAELQSRARRPTSPRSTSSRRNTGSTSRCGSSTYSGPAACCTAIWAILSPITCRSTQVVGDRLLLTFHRVVHHDRVHLYRRVSDRRLFGDAPIQLDDHGLTFLGFLGLATPSFLLALVLLYLANVYFGISIGGLMDPLYVNQPWSWARPCRWRRISGSRSSSSAPRAPPR